MPGEPIHIEMESISTAHYLSLFLARHMLDTPTFDNKLTTDYCRKILRRAGYSVESESEGTQGTEKENNEELINNEAEAISGHDAGTLDENAVGYQRLSKEEPQKEVDVAAGVHTAAPEPSCQNELKVELQGSAIEQEERGDACGEDVTVADNAIVQKETEIDEGQTWARNGMEVHQEQAASTETKGDPPEAKVDKAVACSSPHGGMEMKPDIPSHKSEDHPIKGDDGEVGYIVETADEDPAHEGRTDESVVATKAEINDDGREVGPEVAKSKTQQDDDTTVDEIFAAVTAMKEFNALKPPATEALVPQEKKSRLDLVKSYFITCKYVTLETWDIRQRRIRQKWPHVADGAVFQMPKCSPSVTCLPISKQITQWAPSILDFYRLAQRGPGEKVVTFAVTGEIMKEWLFERGGGNATEEEIEKENLAKERELAMAEVQQVLKVSERERRRAPKRVLAYDLGELIALHEKRIHAAFFSPNSKTSDEFDETSNLPYWPSLTPFCLPLDAVEPNTPKMTPYVPHILLPRKLIVHDPWHLLRVARGHRRSAYRPRRYSSVASEDEGEFSEEKKRFDPNTPWRKMEDKVRVYNLRPAGESNDLHKRDREDERRISEAAKKYETTLSKFLEDPCSLNLDKPRGLEVPQEQINAGNLDLASDIFDHPVEGPAKPPLYVVLPPNPLLPPKAPEEAHLYLVPRFRKGEGHHSLVYRAEWEVPRDWVMHMARAGSGGVYSACEVGNPTAELECPRCIAEEVMKVLEEEDGENGERRDPKWDEMSGEYRYVEEGENLEEITTVKDGQEYIIHPEEKSRKVLRYHGPYRPIVLSAKPGDRGAPQDLSRGPYCVHLHDLRECKPPLYPHPLKTKVRVAAKLSVKGDDHLVNEANTYAGFPRHFFERWSGLGMVRGIEDPVPLGEVVPKFYGYYEPDESELYSTETVRDGESETCRRKAKPYLSPILLIEDCGWPIDLYEMSKDDISECVSLLKRFHSEGYNHNSVYIRNILRQPGPLSIMPSERTNRNKAEMLTTDAPHLRQKEWSYRVIDFGRSDHGKEAERSTLESGQSMEAALANWLRTAA